MFYSILLMIQNAMPFIILLLYNKVFSIFIHQYIYMSSYFGIFYLTMWIEINYKIYLYLANNINDDAQVREKS